VTQLLDRPRKNRPFARADILSQLGETIFLPELISPSRPKPPEPPKQHVDEDPERWDGLG